MYQAVLHLSLLSTILVLLQKCTSSQLYLSTASKNCITEKVFYILLPLYLMLASVPSCTTSIIGTDHLVSLKKMYFFTPVFINSFSELDSWDSCLHSTDFVPDVSICMKLYCIDHWYGPSCFSCKSVHLHTCTYQLLQRTVLVREMSTFYCVYTRC